jgi:hypothetical protein
MAFKMSKKITSNGLTTNTGKEAIRSWIEARSETGRFENQLGNNQMESGLERLNTARRVSRDEMYNMGYNEVSRLQMPANVPAGMYGLEENVYFAEPTLYQKYFGNKNSKDTNIHELAHTFERGTTNKRDLSESNIEKAIKNIPVLRNEEGYTTEDYMDPKEVYAELMKFRIKNKIDPKKEFNQKDLPKLRKNLSKESNYGMFNINDMYDDNNLLRLMNEVVDSGKNTNLNLNIT